MLQEDILLNVSSMLYSQRGGGEGGVGALELAVECDAALVAVVRQRGREVQHLLQAGARLQRAPVPDTTTSGQQCAQYTMRL